MDLSLLYFYQFCHFCHRHYWRFGKAQCLDYVFVYRADAQLLQISSLLPFANWGNSIGLVWVFFVLVLAAAEAAVGLAIIINLFRSKQVVDVDQYN